jgi:zinc-binding dehydrogenase
MDLRPGSRLAVLGTGTVGLAAVMMAHHLGVRQIIAVDTNPGRLGTASGLGATHTVDASDREAGTPLPVRRDPAGHRRHGSRPGHQARPADDRRRKRQGISIMTNDDGATPASNRVPDSLVMPFANVRHLGFRDKVRAARLAGFAY